MIVVLDTNVFARQTHLLRKAGGPTLVHFLRATKGHLLISEILRRECVEQSIEMANEGRHNVDHAPSTLNTLLGLRLENPFRGSETVRSETASRLRVL